MSMLRVKVERDFLQLSNERARGSTVMGKIMLILMYTLVPCSLMPEPGMGCIQTVGFNLLGYSEKMLLDNTAFTCTRRTDASTQAYTT